MVAALGRCRAMVIVAYATCFVPKVEWCQCVCTGQLKLGRSGEYCLSQRGFTAGAEDVAVGGAISASSSADATAHGANMAVDGSSSTFWV